MTDSLPETSNPAGETIPSTVLDPVLTFSECPRSSFQEGVTMKIRGFIVVVATMVWSLSAHAEEAAKRSDVPMTRPEEAIAVIDGSEQRQPWWSCPAAIS